jgi:hypothetical protein
MMHIKLQMQTLPRAVPGGAQGGRPP